MSTTPQMIPAAEALLLQSLVSPTEQGIASRVLAKTSGGNLTLFAFDAAQGLTEHTSPFDALVMVLEGSLILTIGGTPGPGDTGHDRAHACQRSARARCARGSSNAAPDAAGPTGALGHSAGRCPCQTPDRVPTSMS